MNSSNTMNPSKPLAREIFIQRNSKTISPGDESHSEAHFTGPINATDPTNPMNPMNASNIKRFQLLPFSFNLFPLS